MLLEQLVLAIGSATAQARQEPLSSSLVPVTNQSVKEICSHAKASLKGYMEADAWVTLEHNLCLAVSNLESYDKKASEGATDSELELLWRLSSAKVCVGLSQAHLLCPSPVDPIVTSRTKYHCLQQLVSPDGLSCISIV